MNESKPYMTPQGYVDPKSKYYIDRMWEEYHKLGLSKGGLFVKKQYREMVNTRKLYRAEVLMYGQRPFSELTKQRSLTYLRKLGETIWKKERYTNQLPVIRFGSSRSHRNIPYSWCDGDTVELAPDQQDILTLIHELVHAVGFDYHNKDFVQEEIYLLQKYTKTNKQLIEEALNV